MSTLTENDRRIRIFDWAKIELARQSAASASMSAVCLANCCDHAARDYARRYVLAAQLRSQLCIDGWK